MSIVATGTLQEVLDRLGGVDSPLRSRALIARSAELQHTPGSRALRDALVEQGLAVARRLGDPVQLARACQAAAVASWWAGNARQRVAWTTEAVDGARAERDDAWLAAALVLRANALGECGQVEEMEAALARSLAERLRLPYPLTVLGTLESAWLAMRGRFAEAQRLASATAGLAERTAVPHRAEAIMSSIGGVLLWQGRAADVLPSLTAATGLMIPLDAPTLLLLLRAHRLDEAMAFLERNPLPLETDDFLMLFRLAVAAEAALVLRLPALGARAYTAMAPYADHVAAAGSGITLGPVSAFLALAAASTGERATAARHADEALERCAA